MGQQTFDPTKVTGNLAGVPFELMASGTMIEIEYDTDAFTDEVGADGSVIRILSADERATVKVTFMQGSPTNDAFSALAILDRLTRKGVGPLQVKDLTGTSVASSENAWLKKIAAKTYGTGHEAVTWEIRCSRLKTVVGSTVEA